MTFGTAADLATMGNGMTDKQRDKGAALWTASVVANLASRTWLSGVTDALEALQDPERYSGNFIKRLIGAATVPTGSAQIARTIDPVSRETPDIPTYMRSEEHTSELQSLMRISYAVFCLKKKKIKQTQQQNNNIKLP